MGPPTERRRSRKEREKKEAERKREWTLNYCL